MAIETIAFVFARGGSKGLPGKNIRLLHGKPLIAHAIDVAKESMLIKCVVVSSDSQQILSIATEFGADITLVRPPELATDASAEWLSWQHAVRALTDMGISFDRFISLPATAPLRTVMDVETCLSAFETGTYDTVVTVTDANRHPDFNMLKLRGQSFERVGRSDVFRRQDAEQVFDMTTVAYVTTPDFILKNGSIFDGLIGAVHIPKARAIDIDDEIDFRIAECLTHELLDKHEATLLSVAPASDPSKIQEIDE